MRIAKRAKRARLILRPNVIRLLMFFWTLEVVRRREEGTSVRSRARRNMTRIFGTVDA